LEIPEKDPKFSSESLGKFPNLEIKEGRARTKRLLEGQSGSAARV
jgi:hypothetical protein